MGGSSTESPRSMKERFSGVFFSLRMAMFVVGSIPKTSATKGKLSCSIHTRLRSAMVLASVTMCPSRLIRNPVPILRDVFASFFDSSSCSEMLAEAKTLTVLLRFCWIKSMKRFWNTKKKSDASGFDLGAGRASPANSGVKRVKKN